MLCLFTRKKQVSLSILLIATFFSFRIFLHACFLYVYTVSITPNQFEKHGNKGAGRKWKKSIWVKINEKKVALWRSGLLKYHKYGRKKVEKRSNMVKHDENNHQFHRDEFITCTRCKKERRFRLRNIRDFKAYHDALASKRWKCPKWPYEK